MREPCGCVCVSVLYKVGRGSQDSQVKVVNERRDEILLAEECDVAKDGNAGFGRVRNMLCHRKV